MPRKLEACLEDIKRSINYVNQYIGEMDKEEFMSDQKTIDAVTKNLENIGEAVKNIPESKRQDDLNWDNIAGFRDFAVHQYFRVDSEILWDIVENELPELEEAVREMRKQMREREQKE